MAACAVSKPVGYELVQCAVTRKTPDYETRAAEDKLDRTSGKFCLR